MVINLCQTFETESRKRNKTSSVRCVTCTKHLTRLWGVVHLFFLHPSLSLIWICIFFSSISFVFVVIRSSIFYVFFFSMGFTYDSQKNRGRCMMPYHITVIIFNDLVIQSSYFNTVFRWGPGINLFCGVLSLVFKCNNIDRRISSAIRIMRPRHTRCPLLNAVKYYDTQRDHCVCL